MQKCISQIVHVLLLLLLLLAPVEEAKLNNRSTIIPDNAHVGTWHWWLVHRHNFFINPFISCDIDDYLASPCTLCIEGTS